MTTSTARCAHQSCPADGPTFPRRRSGVLPPAGFGTERYGRISCRTPPSCALSLVFHHLHDEFAGYDQVEPVYYETAPVAFDDRLLTADEVAALLAIPRSSVYEYARRTHDPLPMIRIGRHVRFVRGELDAWIVAQRGMGPEQSHRLR